MPRAHRGSAVATADLASELARIQALPIDEARSLWLAMTGRSPSREFSGDLLRRMICYRLQEQALGGLNRKLAAMLDRLGEGGAPVSRLRPGCVLVREHNGILHQVMVLRIGFAWNGQTHPSLSAAAKAITGTAWNGNRFFGLERGKRRTPKESRVAARGSQFELSDACVPNAGLDVAVDRLAAARHSPTYPAGARRPSQEGKAGMCTVTEALT